MDAARGSGVGTVSGTGGDPATTLEEMLRTRAAYRACIRANVEVEYCEHMVDVWDKVIRAYIANRT